MKVVHGDHSLAFSKRRTAISRFPKLTADR
jgi:hypothetical protein